MVITEYLDQGLLLGMFAAFGGCSIRYADLYKKHRVNLHFYAVDSLISLFLGAFSYLYLTTDLQITVFHAALFNILLGNLGSQVITIAVDFFKGNFKEYLYNAFRSYLDNPEAKNSENHKRK